MSDPTAQEPTMEEILASIRRIISEDDAPAAEHPAAAPAAHEPEIHMEPAPAPAPEPVHLAAVPSHVLHEPEAHEEEDVLELTEPAPVAKSPHDDLDVFEPESVKPEPVKAVEWEPVKSAPVVADEPASSFKAPDEDLLISGGSADKAASHFGKLSQSIMMPAAGRTLEDVVAELLKPLLKDWLDEHLPGIVEEKVQAEVERISRRRV